MDAFNKYLQQFPHYTPSVYENAYPFLSEKTVGSGNFLLQQGKISRSIAFIEKGLLRQYYLNDGKEVTNCFCRENTITTSYKSLITQQESDIAIQAVEESKLIILSYDSLQKLFNKDLFWQQVGRLTAENEFITSESHNRFLRDLSATDRYLHILNNDKELLQRVPLNHLATYLQIAPETLSRIRNKIMRT
ncbi:MAG: cyclic nucleotide-binding domain-containing protein [Flavobacteriaceae bacterium]|nr:cyclic nucleotide-binding domain-containing protein [Flavobacteriaceae bacterium]